MSEQDDAHQDGKLQRNIWNYFDTTKVKTPGPRFSPSTTYLPSKHMLMLFGGFIYKKEELEGSSDCFLYDFANKKWINPTFNDDAPKESFAGHSMSLVKGKDKKPKTILIGAPVSNTKIYMMDVEALTWSEEKANTTKWLTLDEDGIVDSGGTSVEVEHHGFGTLVKTETVDNKVVQKKGLFPNTRSYHVMVVHEERYIYIHGGYINTSQHICNDMWKLDSHTMEWTKIEGKGLSPTKRFGHQATIVNGSIYMFGGSSDGDVSGELFKYNIQSNIWSKVIIANNPPTPRAGHSMCYYENKLIILWGRNFNHFVDDICIVDLDENEGKTLTFTKPQCRQAHSIVTIPNKGDPLMLVYGGCCIQDQSPRPLSEFYAVDLIALFVRAQLIPNRPFLQPKQDNVIMSSLVGFDTDVQLKGYKIKKKRRFSVIKKNPEKPEKPAQSPPPQSSPPPSQPSSSQTTKMSNNNSSEFHHYLTHGAKEITNWLAKLDLARYAHCFVKEEIDLDSLSHLSDSDLKDIGVDKMGPRRRILSESSKLALLYEDRPLSETDTGMVLVADRISNLTNSINEHFQYMNDHLSRIYGVLSHHSGSSSLGVSHHSSVAPAVETPSPSHFSRQQSLKHSPSLLSSSDSPPPPSSSSPPSFSKHSPLRSSSLVTSPSRPSFASDSLSINTSTPSRFKSSSSFAPPSNTSPSSLQKPSMRSSSSSSSSSSSNNASSLYVLPHLRDRPHHQSLVHLDFPYHDDFILRHLPSIFDEIPSSIAWTDSMKSYSYS